MPRWFRHWRSARLSDPAEIHADDALLDAYSRISPEFDEHVPLACWRADVDAVPIILPTGYYPEEIRRKTT